MNILQLWKEELSFLGIIGLITLVIIIVHHLFKYGKRTFIDTVTSLLIISYTIKTLLLLLAIVISLLILIIALPAIVFLTMMYVIVEILIEDMLDKKDEGVEYGV